MAHPNILTYKTYMRNIPKQTNKKKTAGSFRKFNYKFQKQMFNKEIYDYDLTFLLSIANRHICMQYQSFNMSLLQYTS